MVQLLLAHLELALVGMPQRSKLLLAASIHLGLWCTKEGAQVVNE